MPVCGHGAWKFPLLGEKLGRVVSRVSPYSRSLELCFLTSLFLLRGHEVSQDVLAPPLPKWCWQKILKSPLATFCRRLTLPPLLPQGPGPVTCSRSPSLPGWMLTLKYQHLTTQIPCCWGLVPIETFFSASSFCPSHIKTLDRWLEVWKLTWYPGEMKKINH